MISFCILGAFLGGAVALISRAGLGARQSYCIEWEERIRAKDREQAREHLYYKIDRCEALWREEP